MGLFAGFVVVCSRCVEWLVVAVVGSIHIFESVSIVGLMVLPIFTALWVHFHAWCVMVLLFLFFVCSRCVEWLVVVVVAGIVHIFTSVSIVGLMILLFFYSVVGSFSCLMCYVVINQGLYFPVFMVIFV